MSIILSVNYNIGINIGDNITNYLTKSTNTIYSMSLIIPELDEEYNIDLVMGNNILASDNILLHNIKLKTNMKVIFLEVIVYQYYMVIIIKNKLNTILYLDTFSYSLLYIPYIERTIDIDNMKLKFDIMETIILIRKKIKLNYIVLDDETNSILEDKLNNIIRNIDNIPNQKMLDIKQNLKMKFFVN
jgi:hypothetical protein